MPAIQSSAPAPRCDSASSALGSTAAAPITASVPAVRRPRKPRRCVDCAPKNDMTRLLQGEGFVISRKESTRGRAAHPEFVSTEASLLAAANRSAARPRAQQLLETPTGRKSGQITRSVDVGRRRALEIDVLHARLVAFHNAPRTPIALHREELRYDHSSEEHRIAQLAPKARRDD